MRYKIDAEAYGQRSANSIKRAKYLVRLWTRVNRLRYYDDGEGTIWVFRDKAQFDRAGDGSTDCLATIKKEVTR